MGKLSRFCIVDCNKYGRILRAPIIAIDLVAMGWLHHGLVWGNRQQKTNALARACDVSAEAKIRTRSAHITIRSFINLSKCSFCATLTDDA
eukprot:411555-Pleurochrysis_carterae.AAC.3